MKIKFCWNYKGEAMIIIKKYVKDSPIITTRFIEFSTSNKKEYITLFNNYRNDKIIDEKSEFHSDKWLVASGVDKRSISFIFSEMLFKKMNKNQKSSIKYEEFILAVKSFYLQELSSYASQTLLQFVNSLKRLMHETEFTSIGELPENLKNNPTFMTYTPLILEFFMYYEGLYFNDDLLDEIGASYIEHIDAKKGAGVSKRALPTFNT